MYLLIGLIKNISLYFNYIKMEMVENCLIKDFIAEMPVGYFFSNLDVYQKLLNDGRRLA